MSTGAPVTLAQLEGQIEGLRQTAMRIKSERDDLRTKVRDLKKVLLELHTGATDVAEAVGAASTVDVGSVRAYAASVAKYTAAAIALAEFQSC